MTSMYGRLRHDDPRDDLYPLRVALPVKVERPKKWWWNPIPPILNQGFEGTCVGHAHKSLLMSGPVVNGDPVSTPTAREIYHKATLLDEWPSNDGDYTFGTSVRAGMKALRDYGFIKEFRKATNIDDLIDWLGTRGPAVIGIDWYQGMATPGQGGLISPTGNIIAGHCILLDGYDLDSGLAGGVNSHGQTWGNNGRFLIRISDLERLLFVQGGDCYVALDVALGPEKPPEPTPPPTPEPEAPPLGPNVELRYTGFDEHDGRFHYDLSILKHW